MGKPKNPEEDMKPDCEQRWLFRLYVAERAQSSIKAIANLKALLEDYLPNCYHLEVLDIIENPLRAISDGVLVTPTLFKIFPYPAVKITGDLSDRSRICSELGLPDCSEK